MTPTMYEFETKNGGSYTRERLIWAKRSVGINGWIDTRDLYMPTEFDLKFFEGVQYRLCLTPNRNQEDELFCSIPCRIKPGTKSILEIYDGEGKIASKVRIRKHFNWY